MNKQNTHITSTSEQHIGKNSVSRRVQELLSTWSEMDTTSKVIVTTGVIVQGGFLATVGFGIYKGIGG